ncbi:H/ACA ribonucleoprotein complex non-core subunit naf1, partial [Terramyces sp. JEL0728]
MAESKELNNQVELQSVAENSFENEPLIVAQLDADVETQKEKFNTVENIQDSLLENVSTEPANDNPETSTNVIQQETDDALFRVETTGEKEEEMSEASLVDLGDSSSDDSSSDEDENKAEVESVQDDFEVIKSKNETIKLIIEPINIILTNEQIIPIGHVHSIVDDTVTISSVQSGEESIVDLDSLVCTKEKTILGRIFDIIGQIKKPIYIVNFNSNQEIKDRNINIGDALFYVPVYSKMVKTNGLKTKGSDASNLYDEEIMEDEQEFSDDEQERLKKRGLEDGEI